MATITKRKNGDGSITYMAQVRVKPYKPTAKAFPTKKDAETWAENLERELRAQRERGGVREDVTSLTLAQLAHEFLEDPETQRLAYHPDLQQYLAWWVGHYGADRVLRINVLTLREARDKLRHGRKPATVNRYLSALRSCWNWGRTAGLLPQDLLWPTRLLLTEPKGRMRYLTDIELTRLLKASAEHSPAMHAAVLVSIGCGVRQSELLRLKWSDVDIAKQRIRVLLTKNDEARSVYLPKSAADALRELKRAAVVGAHVFIEDDGMPAGKGWLRYRWQPIQKAAKLDDFRWHDLRHSCASFLAQQGANLLEIGSVLGHKSPAVTRRYSHLVEGAPVTGHTKLDEKLKGKS